MKVGVRVDKKGEQVILTFVDPTLQEDFAEYNIGVFPCFVVANVKKEWFEQEDA
jgi:hypothetical protein